MKFLNHIIFISGLCSLLFTSCKNDLKLNAPYKEIPSIYAVLTPQDAVQMIRVNKVFLGEGDANKMAQVADSINYPAGELTVTLIRSVNGALAPATASSNPYGVKNTITFYDSIIQAFPGSFNTTQRVYVSHDQLCVSGDYTLTVKNNRSGKVFTAKATSMDCVNGTNGFTPFCLPLYPVASTVIPTSDTHVNYGKPQNTYSIRFHPNTAVIYELTMRLHYYNLLLSGDSSSAFVEYPFVNQTMRDVTTNNLGTFLVNTFRGSDVYSAFGISLSKNSLSVSQITARYMYMAEFIVYSSTQEYADYLQFSAPSLSIAQEKPLYSNFTNHDALGLFTFRPRVNIQKSIDTEFSTQFAINPNTCHFKFYQMPDRIFGFCP